MCTVFSVVSVLCQSQMAGKGERPHQHRSRVLLGWTLPCIVFEPLGSAFSLLFLFQWSGPSPCDALSECVGFHLKLAQFLSARCDFFFFLFLPGQLSCRNVAKIYECALRYFVCFSERGDRALSPFRLNLKRLSQRCSVRGFVACIPAFSRQCVVCLQRTCVLHGESRLWLLVCRGALLFPPPTFWNWCVEKIFVTMLGKPYRFVFPPVYFFFSPPQCAMTAFLSLVDGAGPNLEVLYIACLCVKLERWLLVRLCKKKALIILDHCCYIGKIE